MKDDLTKLRVVALAAGSLACASAPAAGPLDPPALSLPEQIDQALAAPPLDQMHWGVLIVDAASGDVLYERESARKFVPASNQKLLVSAAALALLGPDFRYETPVFGAGELNDGTLDGDLVVVGRGDPTWSARYHPTAAAPLDSLADSLVAAGVRTVTRDVVIDASLWDSTSVPSTWMVEDLAWPWGASGGAFAIGEGELELVISGGAKPGERPAVTWTPEVNDDFVRNDLVTVPSDSFASLRPRYLHESKRIALEGEVVAGTVDTTGVSVRDPVGVGAKVLLARLRARGIVVNGDVRVAWTAGERVGEGCRTGVVDSCTQAVGVASLRSPPMTDVVEGVLKPSQNWMAEQVVRSLGAEKGEEGSWSEGFEVLAAFLTEQVQIDSTDFVLRDGSGMSAYNLVTPRALVKLLRYMRQSPHAEAFRDALAAPGEEDSTLENRLDALEGRVFAKTGTITHVNSLSGYLVDRRGRDVVFSIMSNNSGLPAPTVRRAIDGVLEMVAR